jgi:hypothetical protein
VYKKNELKTRSKRLSLLTALPAGAKIRHIQHEYEGVTTDEGNVCSSLTFGVSVWYFINDKEESPLITTRLCNVNLLQEMDPKKKGSKSKTSPSPAVSVEVPVWSL